MLHRLRLQKSFEHDKYAWHSTCTNTSHMTHHTQCPYTIWCHTQIHRPTHAELNHEATPLPKSHGEPSNEAATIIRYASHHDTNTRPANPKPSEHGDTCKSVTHHHLSFEQKSTHTANLHKSNLATSCKRATKQETRKQFLFANEKIMFAIVGESIHQKQDL